MQTQVMVQRFKMFLRDFREYVNGGKAKRAAEWREVADKAEADALRAAQVRYNRSRGARKGWETRRAKVGTSAQVPTSGNAADATAWEDDGN